MLFIKFLLLVAAFGFLACAVGMVLYDVYLAFELSRILRRGERPGEPELPVETSARVSAWPRPRRVIRWNIAAKFVAIAALTGFAGSSIMVVPDGEAGVRVSQISGVLPGTLYAGTHFIVPLFDRVVLYDVRDKVLSTAASEGPHEKLEVLTVEAREGLPVGLAVTVRYRIDPRRLDYIQANLPQPVDDEIVAPVVSSAFHELAPTYVVRDIFAAKREEFRQRAAQLITERLAGDAIVVKEVLLRQIDLPEEYAKGLEDLLLKEQEDDETSVDAEIEQKRVQIAASQAEGLKVREVKHAEADAQSRVIMAKADSDSMQYTLPLKQKQIEQSRLEAVARKEATIENAEADAQAKVIDSKAEQQRQNLLADAEANRIRVTSQAQSEELQLEAAALKANPLLVQYTVAQKLSDKVQIMLVPNDGKFFFTNDVLRSAMSSDPSAGSSDPPVSANARP
jgi:regulator of protease activity HflC (stomatin/prohibitin superfamily)